MDFRTEIDNIQTYGHNYGFYCVPIPFLRPEFAHAATQLTVWNDALGGMLAITSDGLWYPFWPERAGERFPELPPDNKTPALYPGHTNWKDACIAAINPAEHVFPAIEDELKETQSMKVWIQTIEQRHAALRDPFVADVNETLLIGLKKMELGD